MIRVGLVDDQELVWEGLAAILEASSDIDVVFQGGDGKEFVTAVRSGTGMDVALVDIRMPGMDGIEATHLVTALTPSPAVVVLTTFAEDEYVVRALRAGAVGFLLKRCTRLELVAGVRAAAAGDAVLSPEITRAVIERMLTGAPVGQSDAPEVRQLTDRELDVLRAIGSGATNAEIAASLHLSESTVKTHVSRVLAKTGCRDRVEAVLLAVRTGLASL